MLQLLGVDLDEAVKLRLIEVVGAMQEEQALAPLFQTMRSDSPAACRAARLQLEAYAYRMSADVRRLLSIAGRVCDGPPVRWTEKFLLRQFLKRGPQWRAVVADLHRKSRLTA